MKRMGSINDSSRRRTTNLIRLRNSRLTLRIAPGSGACMPSWTWSRSSHNRHPQKRFASLPTMVPISVHSKQYMVVSLSIVPQDLKLAFAHTGADRAYRAVEVVRNEGHPPGEMGRDCS